jgi:subtilisin family serine protease
VPPFSSGRWGFRPMLGLLCAVLATMGLLAAPASTQPADDPTSKIEGALAATLAAKGSAEFLVYFKDQADTSFAKGISDWARRGQAVVDTLRRTAGESQAGVRARLDGANADYRAYWIANAIYVRAGSSDLASSIAADPEVSQVRANHVYDLPKPAPGQVEQTIDAVEWGIAAINADDAWGTFGARGEGIVVANIDTGVQFDHPALVRQYRGNQGGGAFDHNYNWDDPSNICGNPSLAPCDNNGHGTHTMGTMVGEDTSQTNQIGVAPAARWIAAKGCEVNTCSDAALLAAGQWVAAPTDLAGANPRPDLRPNIVNNSWGSANGSIVDPWYEPTVLNWINSGIFPAFSNGNAGSGCNTSGSPGDYQETYSSGAFDINGNIASFSSRGPGENGDVKPNLASPGVNVRSSIPGNGYASFNGTSMASPHTSGTVALMWSAAPSLIGDISTTRLILDDTATDTPSAQCGGTNDDNNVWGEGKLNAFAAVDQSPRGPTGTLTGTVTNAASGAPIAGARVDVTGPSNRTVLTGADGTYRITLPVGDYTVAVSAFGFNNGTASVTITEGQTTTQDFALDPASSFTVSGVVSDSDGNPVANATVVIQGTPIPPATTGADGAYSFSNVPAGSYTVAASAGACFGAQSQSLVVDGDETLNFTLPARGDSFGYTCVIEGPGYVEGDTPLALSGDDASTVVNLPFPFFFYGSTYGRAFVTTNGHINFLAANSSFSNVAIPAASAPNAAIYPFWDDLLVDASTSMRTMTAGTAPNRTFLIEWRNVTFFNATSLRVDVEAELSENGSIVFRYRNLGPDQRELGSSATVGIENQTGTVALQYSFNTAALSGSQSIRFRSPPTATVTGLVTDFNDGQPIADAQVRLLSGSTVVATLTTGADGRYSARALLGTYTVEASKQLYATATAPVTLDEANEVVSQDFALHTPRATVTPDSLWFLATDGQLRTATVVLGSTSDLDLTFSLTSDSPWLWAVPGSGTVGAGSSWNLTVRVDASRLAPGVHRGTITLSTNAGRTPSIDIPVSLVVPAYRTGVDSGGGGLIDRAGDAWVADRAWTSGGFGYVGSSSVNSTRQAIAGTDDDALYQTQREGMSGYQFDALPAGTYEVELSFAELRGGISPNRRVFDVTLNGTPVLPGYDIANRVGSRTADRHTFLVTVPEGGTVDVRFLARTGHLPPVINAVRVTHRPDL